MTSEARTSQTTQVDELRGLLRTVSPLSLLLQVAYLTSVGDPLEEDGGARFGNEAKVEYLGALAAEAASPKGPKAKWPQVQRAMVLLHDLFVQENRGLVELAEKHRLAGDEVGQAVALLRREYSFDRMGGYTAHLREIVERTFSPYRDVCVEAVGFSPSAVPAVVVARVQDIARRFEREQDRLGVTAYSRLEVWLPEVLSRLADVSGDVFPAQLAATSGIPYAEVSALLAALTTPWGAGAAPCTMEHESPLRRRPLLRGTGGFLSWPAPWSALHEVMPWFLGVLRTADTQDLRAAISSHARSEATEALVAERLASVFGEDSVYRSFEYRMPGNRWAECDVVVDLPGHTLAIECKSGAVHDAYRAGDAGLLGDTIREFAAKPFEQSKRASVFLRAGGAWRLKEHRAEVREWKPSPAVTRIAVSLERVDVLSTIASRTPLPMGASATWLVCLADLLLVVDSIPDRNLLYRYFNLRAELAADRNFEILNEADVLSLFMDDRLANVRARLAAGEKVQVRFEADKLNAYWSTLAVAPSLAGERPTCVLGRKAAETLDARWAAADPTWAATVDALDG